MFDVRKMRTSKNNENKKTLYLHVGMNKTGTSAIQKFLSNNYESLLIKNFCYPKTSRRTSNIINHHGLFMSLHKKQYPNYRGNNFAQQFEELIQETKEYDNVIISSEILPRIPDIKELKIFKNYFDLIKVVIYVRRYDNLFESAQNQVIKQEFTNIKINIKPRPFHNCKKFAAIFGKRNIICKVYDKKRFYRGDLIKDFLNVLNIDNYNELKFIKSPVNPSLDSNTFYYKQAINNYLSNYEESSQVSTLLLLYQKEHRGQKLSLLTTDQRKALLKERMKDAEKCYNRYYYDKNIYSSLFDHDNLESEVSKYKDQHIIDITKFIKDNNQKLYDLIKKKIENDELQTSWCSDELVKIFRQSYLGGY